MLLERFKNNTNLVYGFKESLIDPATETAWSRPFCYIRCTVTFNNNEYRFIPIIARPQMLRSNELSNPNNYSILAAPSRRKLNKICDSQKGIVLSKREVKTIGISQETYDRIKKASENLIREILKEIGNEYNGVGFKSESALIKAVDDAFLVADEIFPENYIPKKSDRDFDPNGRDDEPIDNYNKDDYYNETHDFERDESYDDDGDMVPDYYDDHDGPEFLYD